MTSTLEISHVIKSKQRLFSNTQRLDSKWVHSFCYEKLNSNPIASVIIAAIYSGRGYDEIVEDAEQVYYEKNGATCSCIKLRTLWEYRKELKSVISSNLSENYNEDLSIHLPDYLWTGICELKESKGSLQEMAKDFLEPLRADCFQAISEEQVRSSFSFQRFAFDIAYAELAFISNSDLHDCINAQYGQMNNQAIQHKLDNYISSFHSSPQCLACKVVYLERVFGSYYTPTIEQIEALFEPLKRNVQQLPTNIVECRMHFNNVTVYLVLMMQLFTMHRPINPFDIHLSQFDLQVNIMHLKDKSGSERMVPTPKILTSLIQQYRRYIDQHISIMQGTQNNQIDKLQDALNSNISLFLQYDKQGKLEVLETSDFQAMLKAHNLKNNWARHFVSSILTSDGVNRDLIAKFMGHSCESGLHYKFSSSSFNDLRSISNILDNQLDTVLQLVTLDFIA